MLDRQRILPAGPWSRGRKIITSVAGIVLALAGCSSAATSTAAPSPKSTERYVGQAADMALCNKFNADIGTDDQAIQDAIGQATGATPVLTKLMEDAIQNAGTVQMAEQGQLAVAADCALVSAGKQPVSDPLGSAASSAAAASPTSAAEPTMTKQTDRIVFKVHGSGYPSIQYGTDSSNNSPPGGHGPLGNGNALPWSGSMTYDSGALYYYVSSQLEGSGEISDSVTEVIKTYCSDGSHKTESFALASGHASGGYNIAQAEYAGGDTGNATQAEADAGC